MASDGDRGLPIQSQKRDVKESSRIAWKLTGLLFLAQSLASAGFIAAATISSIVGAELSREPSWAGVPSAVYLSSGALAALMWGYLMDSMGRRGGLALGLAAGVIGSAVAAFAIVAGSFPLFLGGLVLTGAANAAVQLGRFAAAEVHPPAERGRAISYVVLGGTVGAVVGPLLVGPTGQWAQQSGLVELAGPYAVGIVLFAVASLMIYLWLRPDPRDLGRELAELYPESRPKTGSLRSIRQILQEPAAQFAVVSMVVAQMVMAMLMVITALHMRVHLHSLSDISVVVSSHTFGMYAFSVISGRLTDQWGRIPVIATGAVTLLVACVMAPLSPEVFPIAVALFLLGLGWNFCYVGGSSLLADQLSPAERARTQGFNDLLIGASAAAGSIGSGVIFAGLGYGATGVAGAVACLIPLGMVLRVRTTPYPRRGVGS